MKLIQILLAESDEGLRETALNDLQPVINRYKNLVNKWTIKAVTSLQQAKNSKNAGRSGDAELYQSIASRADYDRKRNQHVLDFLETVQTLVKEQSSDGDEEAKSFVRNSIGARGEPNGPAAHLPSSMSRFLGL